MGEQAWSASSPRPSTVLKTVSTGREIVHVVHNHFLGFDLLRRDFAVGIKEVLGNRTDVCQVLASSAVK